MTKKKNDLPAFPFYFGDWRKAGEIRALDLGVRMIWFEMLGFMWESTERGYLTLNGKPVSNSVITKMLGIDITTFEQALQQMEEFNVFSRREDGAIYSRKMVRDEEIRLVKSASGKQGMKKRYEKTGNNSVITSDITKVLTNPENENENISLNNKVVHGENDSFCFDLKDSRRILLESFSWKEDIQRYFKTSQEEVEKRINEFFNGLQLDGDQVRSLHESKRHFRMWMSKVHKGEQKQPGKQRKEINWNQLAIENEKLIKSEKQRS